jgi:CHASE1-domain containing sensor protein
MSAATENPPVRTRPWSAFPWLVLAVGIAASVVSFTVIQDAVENVAELRFQRQAGDTKAVIEHRVNFYADILYGMKALFASQGQVSREQFHGFVKSLDLKKRYPGFDVVNYMVYVRHDDKGDSRRPCVATPASTPAATLISRSGRPASVRDTT